MLFQTFAVAIAFAAHTLAALPGNGLQGRTCQNPQSNDDKSICKAASCYWTQLRSYATQVGVSCVFANVNITVVLISIPLEEAVRLLLPSRPRFGLRHRLRPQPRPCGTPQWVLDSVALPSGRTHIGSNAPVQDSVQEIIKLRPSSQHRRAIAARIGGAVSSR